MATLIKTITDALGNIILPRTRAEAVTLEDGVTTIQDVVDTADAHYANTSNPHSTTAVQVGADPTGTASTAVSNHVAASDPHAQYLKENPTTAEVGALPMPDAGNYFPGDDTLGTQMQSVGSQLAQYTKLSLTNLVANGNFSNGLNRWGALASTHAVVDGVLTNTGDGSTYAPNEFCSIDAPIVGNKYYFLARVRVTNSECQNITFSIGDAWDVPVNMPNQNTWYQRGCVVTAATSSIWLPIYHVYGDAATANGKVMEMTHVLAINLTTVFGSGNEPTAEEMDNLMKNFSNSWFDGTGQIDITQIWKCLLKEIHDIKTAYIAAHGGSL